MRIPIAMTTYERLDYFMQTYHSLSNCGEDISALSIYDDGSQEDNKLLFLIDCAANGAHVAINPINVGPYQAAIKAISETWAALPDSPYCIYTQDDVEFSKGCFSRAVRIAEVIKENGYNLGILSLYHRAIKVPAKEYGIMPIGHPGAVCWLIVKDFWQDFTRHGVEKPCEFAPNDRRKKHFIRNLIDYKICRWAQMSGYTVAYTRNSLVQHIGDKSTLSDNDMRYCRTSNFVGEIK